MAKENFYLRVSSRTFEYYAGHGYRDEGGAPVEMIPLNEFWSLHLSVKETIRNEAGEDIGVRFRDQESGELYDVFPGKVYNIDVWTTAIDDDGCPEDICISFYVELVPCTAV